MNGLMHQRGGELMADGNYKPSLKVSSILTWCLEKINEVPYKVSLRWVFYRAVQEQGLLKDDYGNFKKWTSRARKNFWGGWAPDTLNDDTRKIDQRGGGYTDGRAWMESFKNELCVLDKRFTQDKIVILCFEAEAMSSQFDHYASKYHVSMVPFKGDATIEPKWRLAKWIEYLYQKYKKPIKILYFGDLDKKGLEIPESAMRDIRAWCDVNFEYERVGLNQDHVIKWGIPENPEKPGYQWEALDDQAARELIEGALDLDVDLEAISKIDALESQAEEKWSELIEGVDLDGQNEVS